MSELYSSASGSYETYLSERQVDQITTTIKQSTDIQMMGMAATTGVLGAKLDSMNAKLKVIGTGLYTAVSKNTLQIAASTEMLKKTFNEGFDAVNNRLDLGFAGISSEIGAMTAAMTAGFDQMKVSLDYWGNEICDKLDAIHDIVNNPLLTASRELYRRAVSNAKKQFFEEALEDIKGAVEKNKTDYISWGLMGRIYLFGVSEFSKTIDVPKALEAFNNACKYISPDVDESEDAKKMAAEYYFYAAYANYILANESRIANKAEDVKKYLEDSIKANAKSYALSNTMYEALYDKARAYSLLEQKENAIKALEEIIRVDGLYSVKALGDPDFKNIEDDIVVLITKLRDEMYSNFEKLKPEILDVIDKYEFVGGSYCNSIKDTVMSVPNLPNNLAYLDIRNVYETTTQLLNTIKNNNIPYDIPTYDEKIEINSENFRKLSDKVNYKDRDGRQVHLNTFYLYCRNKNNLKLFDDEKIDLVHFDFFYCDFEKTEIESTYEFAMKNNDGYTYDHHVKAIRYVNENYKDINEFNRLKNQTYIAKYCYEKYGEPGCFKSIKYPKKIEGRYTDCYERQGGADQSRSPAVWKHPNERKLVCDVDENTIAVINETKRDTNKGEWGFVIEWHLTVFQKGIVAKQFLMDKENERKAIEQQKANEEAEKKRQKEQKLEEERQRAIAYEERRKQEEKASKTTTIIISIVIIAVILVILFKKFI